MTYEEFVGRDGARLRAGLVAAYGPQVGADAAAEALAYGFEHWQRLESMENPAGYLYRVGQTTARREFRPQGYLPRRAASGDPVFEPGWAPALAATAQFRHVQLTRRATPDHPESETQVATTAGEARTGHRVGPLV